MTHTVATRETQALLDVAVDAVVIIDHRGIIETFNRAAERLFGYSAAEAVGTNVSLLMPEPHRSLHDDYIDRYLASGISRVIGIGREVDARRKDGSIFPASLAIGRIPESDPPRFVGFLHDLTSQREAAEEQQRMQHRMAQVSHLATMGEMAASIAHEINQPLSAISNYAVGCEQLLDAPNPEIAEVQSALRQISGQALRAGEIIRRLRSLVRTRQPRRERADINELVRELSILSQSDARMNDVRLHFELAEGLPPINVDGIQIQQVLLNLVRNAIEALAASDHDLRQVVLRTRRHGPGEIEISVSDSGPGVHPTIVARMFDPFCSTKEEGSGLGLSISKSIVEAHRGGLEHRPNTPRGACFTVTLPVLVEEDP